jgi:hypothetical protein
MSDDVFRVEIRFPGRSPEAPELAGFTRCALEICRELGYERDALVTALYEDELPDERDADGNPTGRFVGFRLDAGRAPA